VPVIESAIIAIGAEIGSRGYDWVKESTNTSNAPLEAAKSATKDTDITVDDLRSAFGRASEGKDIHEFATQSKEVVINSVVEQLDSADDVNSREVVDQYLENLENNLVNNDSEYKIVLKYLRKIEENTEIIISELEQSRYYRAYEEEDFDDAIIHLKKQLGLVDSIEYVERPELPSNLAVKHLIVGSKGSGKSRALLHYAKSRLERSDIQTVILPSPAVQRLEDIGAALKREYQADVLLIWDDIHSINRPAENSVFYEFVLKLESNLRSDQQLHVMATCRSEEQSKLQHYNHWEEDQLWSQFDRTRLQLLDGETVDKMVDNIINYYNLRFDNDVCEAFRNFAKRGGCSPFFLFSAGYFLASEKLTESPEGVITHADLLDIPPYGAAVWEKQYEQISKEFEDARYVLLSIKILHEVTTQYDYDLVRGLFVELFDREELDFDRAVRRLKNRQWLSLDDSRDTLELHSIQIAGINEKIENMFDDFAHFLVTDALQYIDNRVAVGLCQGLLLKILMNPTRDDEQIFEETMDRMLNSELSDDAQTKEIHAIHINYAGYLYTNDRTNEALYHTTKAIQLMPEDAKGYINHATIASYADFEGIAKGAFSRAIELIENDDERAIIRVRYARYLNYLNRQDVAIEMFLKAIEESDHDPYICQRYASYLESVDQIGRARTWHQKATNQSDELALKARHAAFLRRHGPPEKFQKFRDELLMLSPDFIEEFDDIMRSLKAPKRQMSPDTHNEIILEQREDFQTYEKAEEIEEEEGASAAAEWLEGQIEKSDSPPLYGTLGDYWVQAGNTEKALDVYKKGLVLAREQNEVMTFVERAIQSCSKLEENVHHDAAISLCDFALEKLNETANDSVIARTKLIRFRSSLKAADEEESLLKSYKLAQSLLFRGDLENSFNCYYDIWDIQKNLSDDNKLRIRVGIPSAVIVLAFEAGSNLLGPDIPLDEIYEFVDENIREFERELSQLFAEVQHQKDIKNPILSQEKIPASEPTLPEDVQLMEEKETEKDTEVIKMEKATYRTMLAYLQGNFPIDKNGE
jgi:tetratricopeptide (TPR) repeat protein